MAKINSRTKGSTNERKTCKLMKEWTGYDFARTPSSGGLRWKRENTQGDIVITEEGIYFPFCVECKAYKKIDFSHLLLDVKSDIVRFWAQASEDALRAKKIPLLLMRYNGLPANFFFIAIRYTDYLKFRKHLKMGPKIRSYSQGLMILTPQVWFESDYNAINKIALNILKR